MLGFLISKLLALRFYLFLSSTAKRLHEEDFQELMTLTLFSRIDEVYPLQIQSQLSAVYPFPKLHMPTLMEFYSETEVTLFDIWSCLTRSWDTKVLVEILLSSELHHNKVSQFESKSINKHDKVVHAHFLMRKGLEGLNKKVLTWMATGFP